MGETCEGRLRSWKSGILDVAEVVHVAAQLDVDLLGVLKRGLTETCIVEERADYRRVCLAGFVADGMREEARGADLAQRVGLACAAVRPCPGTSLLQARARWATRRRARSRGSTFASECEHPAGAEKRPGWSGHPCPR